MRRRVLIHRLVFNTIAAINVVYPAHTTKQIVCAAVRKRPPDGAFATRTAPMRWRGLLHLNIFDTIAAINMVYPTPMTTRIAYAAVHWRPPTVHLQHKPRRCVGVF